MIELSVIVPTYNEKDNVPELFARLETVLQDVLWEVIFVDDDSPDETSDVVRTLAQMKPNIRCLQRIGRRGLSRAVIEGILATSSPYIAVMDADLQHDETLLPKMLQKLRADNLDMVVGSRYCDGGSVGQWDSSRATLSRVATILSRLVVTSTLSDPMSGFFVMRRDMFARAMRRLSGDGYKILLDLFASSPNPPKFTELPYTFRERKAGESKLDSAVLWEYLLLIVDKKLGWFAPARFIVFCLIGFSGLFVHLLTLWIGYKVLELDFTASQTAATLVAMTSNYTFNNLITYRDRRRRGLRFFTGLFSFYVICGIGVVGNVGVANFVFQKDYTWWLAGGVGALVGTVWNYAASSLFTWGRN